MVYFLSGNQNGIEQAVSERSVPARIDSTSSSTPVLELEIGQAETLPNSPVSSVLSPKTAVRRLQEAEILVKYEFSPDGCYQESVIEDRVTRQKTFCNATLRFDHHYDDFSYEQLLQIHETDALASYILGMKTFHDKNWQEHFEYATSVNHLHRAAVLSGKAQPYLDMLRARQLDRNQQPASEFTRKEAYVWYTAGMLAGVLEEKDLPEWIRGSSLAEDQQQLDAWNKIAAEYAQTMTNQRAYQTGSTFQN